jgi:hypothetical protein
MMKRVAGLMKVAAYVGVPAAKSSRKGEINNAELLFIFEHGSPIHKQPARPLLKPAINADGNKQKIAAEINGSIRLSLAGDSEGSKKKMQRAALAGQNAARGWFTDGRNGWAPNALSTIKAKGSDRPGIWTGAMRASIVGVVREE